MRIVAGEWGSRRLVTPSGGIRPTQDRVRQILFDILGGQVALGAVLDLYAGSGALGLEALSRGAPEAVFVEFDRGVRKVLERNLQSLGAGLRGRVLGVPVEQAISILVGEGARFRTILADPPYGDPGVLRVLQRIGAEGAALLEEGGEMVLETGRGDPVPDRCGRLRRYRERQAGSTALHFFVNLGSAGPVPQDVAGGWGSVAEDSRDAGSGSGRGEGV